MATLADVYCQGPTRVQFRDKDPKGWQEFHDQFAAQSAIGHGLTMRGVQLTRPSVYELEAELERLTVPTLIVTGDEDEPCLEPGIFLKRKIRTSGLVVIPKAGHTINLEEPEAFNRAVLDFLTAVESGRWGSRNPASQTGSAILPSPQGNRNGVAELSPPAGLSRRHRTSGRAGRHALSAGPRDEGVPAEREPERKVRGAGDPDPEARRDLEARRPGRRVDAERPPPEVAAVVAERDPQRLGEPARSAGERGQRPRRRAARGRCPRRRAIAQPGEGLEGADQDAARGPAGPAMAFRQAWRP